MKTFIKNFVNSYEIIFHVFNSLTFLITSSLNKIKGDKKKYPKVIQLPITYKCNSRCVMCNIWQMDYSNEASFEEFKIFIGDDIFKKVKAVGINGGEPTLVPKLTNYTKEILKLPKIKSLNLISNGYNSRLLLRLIEEIHKECSKNRVSFHVSISLDGFRNIHNIVRGLPNAFAKTSFTIDEIIKNKHKYCNSYDIGCTIVKQNIHNLVELYTFAKIKNYEIKYRLGIENKRIESDKLRDQFSVVHSPHRQSAKEFFHFQMSQAKTFSDKFKYFSIFYWLNSAKPKRLLGCIWKDEGITLDSRGELYYCAVASNSIGNLGKSMGEKIFFDDVNINYRKGLISDFCDGCIHDYSGKPELQNLIIFFKYIIQQHLSMKIYQIKARRM